jgi:hypothetical protein
MQNNNYGIKKPFIPRDKPKSFVIAIIAGLIGGLIGGPVMFGGHFLGISGIIIFGKILFMACWLVAASTGIFFAFGLITGKYKNIEDKDWNHQLW